MYEDDDTPENATVQEGLRTEGLPKWPAHVVIGESVTPEQARAIIIRTTAVHYLVGNDRDWNQQVHAAFGFEVNDLGYPVSPCFRDDEHDHYWQPREGEKDQTPRQMCSPVNRHLVDQLGILPLSYIENDRLCSSYIGGANGWMHWDGSILQKDKNVGKWPGELEILRDWATVAAAFPFLELTATLWNGEAGYMDNPKAVVQYVVSKGHVTMQAPTDDAFPVEGRSTEDEVAGLMLRMQDPSYGRGVDIATVRQAIEDARASAQA